MKLLVIFLVSAWVLVSIHPTEAADAAPSDTTPKTVNGNGDLEILPSKLPIIERNALDGSSAAAVKLSEYYQYILIDLKKSYFWATIGAENGGAEAKYILGNMILSADCTTLGPVLADNFKDDQSRYARAMYWYTEAAKAGNQSAQQNLELFKNGGRMKQC